ncbi:DUF1275 domain-containing protein [Pedobacter sp. MC2016-14]|uniref:YoaK family protein n=1 Tax=Pedobacter sp. MC2016-14 TaxID=2897327 RepID=UPI001E3E9EC8|nr:YoaK family protein [Pedobacter sp. MC2016-14]MCD0487872.1 DUF1275 domain-containing protein [Pedobacter sp. MC2016-14]
MEIKKSIGFVTLVLTIVAGYCDTITFVAADKIFSAHVTGNFIVFAYQMIKGAEPDSWVKLLTFPVFLLAVMTGGWISSRIRNHHFLLCCEGILLILAGALAYVLCDTESELTTISMYVVTMIVVFAMGFQNAFGKLFAKETHGPTTMMTGNVTQVALDLSGLFATGFTGADYWVSLKKGLITLAGFLIGCVLGAIAGQWYGLAGVVLPGVAMVICYFSTPAQEGV